MRAGLDFLLIQMQAPSLEPDVSSRRFQAKKAPWCPSGSGSPEAHVCLWCPEQLLFVCVLCLSASIWLAFCHLFFCLHPVSICLPALSKPIMLGTDLAHFPGQMLKYILSCIKNNLKQAPSQQQDLQALGILGEIRRNFSDFGSVPPDSLLWKEKRH